MTPVTLKLNVSGRTGRLRELRTSDDEAVDRRVFRVWHERVSTAVPRLLASAGLSRLTYIHTLIHACTFTPHHHQLLLLLLMLR